MSSFDTEWPAGLAGLATARDIISQAEEQSLISAINAAQLAPFRFGPWTGNRLTASYGFAYDFEVHRALEAEPIPEWLLPWRARLGEAFGIVPTALIQALLTRYDPGAGIGWHRDRPVYGQVLGLSLGTPATLRFRRRRVAGFDRATLPLEPRSAYCLHGPVRDDWEHSIVPLDQRRWSITFRTAR